MEQRLRSGGARLPTRYSPAAGLLALLIGGWPAAGFAQLSATPHAGVDVEHNSNVFDLSSGGPAPQGKNGQTFGDTTIQERAGVDAAYLLGQQKFFAVGEVRHFDYQNFTSLSHNEDTLNGGLNWTFGRVIDGKVDYLHEQRMVQFMDLAASTALVLETENRGRASANIRFTPEWRLDSMVTDRVLNSPRSDVPGLSLHEDAVHEAVRYLGVANLAAGVDVEYLNGTYRHDPLALNPKYDQTTVALAATYLISGLTDFKGALGYTRRNDRTTTGGQSALTGTVDYRRSLTAKTTLELNLNRAVNSYLTTGGNELDTTAGFSVAWQATYRTTVRLGYSWTNSSFSQSAVNGQDTRVDHFQAANADATYFILRWLSLRPYVRYLTRSSSQGLFEFNGTVVGIELLAKPAERKR